MFKIIFVHQLSLVRNCAFGKVIPIKMKRFSYVEISNYSRIRGTCPQIFLIDVLRFSTKQIKCSYLQKINQKSRTRLNGYFYIKMEISFLYTKVCRNAPFTYVFDVLLNLIEIQILLLYSVQLHCNVKYCYGSILNILTIEYRFIIILDYYRQVD